MTLDQAVGVLNREKHRGATCWAVSTRGCYAVNASWPAIRSADAIAIAQRYERRQMPLTIAQAVKILSERRHAGSGSWDYEGTRVFALLSSNPADVMSWPEAIAIAEEYERDAASRQEPTIDDAPQWMKSGIVLEGTPRRLSDLRRLK